MASGLVNQDSSSGRRGFSNPGPPARQPWNTSSPVRPSLPRPAYVICPRLTSLASRPPKRVPPGPAHTVGVPNVRGSAHFPAVVPPLAKVTWSLAHRPAASRPFVLQAASRPEHTPPCLAAHRLSAGTSLHQQRPTRAVAPHARRLRAPARWRPARTSRGPAPSRPGRRGRLPAFVVPAPRGAPTWVTGPSLTGLSASPPRVASPASSAPRRVSRDAFPGARSSAMWTAVGPWGLCAGFPALVGLRHAGLFLGGARRLHGSSVSWGKNLLKKFASKTRKKFWYEGPTLGSHLTYKPPQLNFLMKSATKKTKKGDHVRLRALNGLLYKALTDLLSTPEVSQETYDLNVELCKVGGVVGQSCLNRKRRHTPRWSFSLGFRSDGYLRALRVIWGWGQVSLTPDFSACRVYWKMAVSGEQKTHTEAVLQRSASHIRHLLMSRQTLRNMPPIVFIQDKESAALAEVDRLLAIADFGPPDEKDDFTQNDFRDPEALDTLDSAPHSRLCEIDHEALNKQIMEYKRRERGKGGTDALQLVATKQTRKRPRVDHDQSQALPVGDRDEGSPDDGRAPEKHPGTRMGVKT
nr:putative ribosome-binding factor A, mitochondrial [Manis javanica]